MLFQSAKNKIDYIIVGLGNPGLTYEKTRHNVGFRCIDELSRAEQIPCDRAKFQAQFGLGEIAGKRCLLLKPQTFMNNSGEAVAAAMRFYKLEPRQLLVISDDISLPVGRLRIRQKGSAGGHNGLKSIIALLGTDTFARVKIGVGQKPHPDYDLADWVLGKFPPAEEKAVSEVLQKAAEAVTCYVKNGAEAAMSRYNS